MWTIFVVLRYRHCEISWPRVFGKDGISNYRLQ